MFKLATLVLGLVFSFITLHVITTSSKGQNCRIQTCAENEFVESLREKAQKALKDIGSTLKPFASKERANRGQHVFNLELLKFHRKVLEELLKDVGGYEHAGNLIQDLMIPLTQTQENAIREMVASFSPNEFYVDYNAAVFGEYVKILRKKLVQYLKAVTSNNNADRYGISKIRQEVQSIATHMVNHEVYVDPMARDRWLQENPKNVQQYNQTRDALKIMFQNILKVFQKVSDKIREFRRRNRWIWD